MTLQWHQVSSNPTLNHLTGSLHTKTSDLHVALFYQGCTCFIRGATVSPSPEFELHLPRQRWIYSPRAVLVSSFLSPAGFTKVTAGSKIIRDRHETCSYTRIYVP